ncbi:ATP-binding cassette domain-containing protein [Nocardia thailandica]|uniref:ATP-binding cassette domain-containing protein n=1 Tax=Nocardia thailandica TaxID=257275 RepID=A0ABW6PSM3_9NOCA
MKPPARIGVLARRTGRHPVALLFVALLVAAACVGPALAPHPLEAPVGMPFAGPGGDVPLGTDRLGRDVLSRLLAGGWGLLLVAAVVAATVTVFSAVLGIVAVLRPRVGRVVETLGDLVILVPAVLGTVLVLTAWPEAGAAGLVVVSWIFGIPYCARIFAAAAAPVVAGGYVEVAVAAGESLPYLVFREVLPNLRAVFAAQLGLRFVVGVYLVSTVAFLSLPGALGEVDWASMVRDNASGLLLNPWAVLAPSAAIAVIAVGVNLVVAGRGAGAGARRSVASGPGRPRPAPDHAARVAPAPAEPPDDRGVPVRVECFSAAADSGAVLVAPLSFQAKAGAVTALTGPSGSGKSTVLRALLGHLPPGARRTGGSVTVRGTDVLALDPDALRAFRRDRVTYIGQDPGSELNPLRRVGAVLAEAAPRATEADRADTLTALGLDPALLRRRCGHLSGGQQRRVALAKALLRRTDILVLDEPLAGLQGELRTDIARRLADLAEAHGVTVVLSSHDLATVAAVAHAVVDLAAPPDPMSGADAPTRREDDAEAPVDSADGRLSDPAAQGVRASAPRAPAGGHGVRSSDCARGTPDSSVPDHSAPVGGGVGRSLDRGGGTPDSSVPDHSAPVGRCGGRSFDRAGETADSSVLRARGIGVSVGGRVLVDGLDLTLSPGESVALVGPSGAGKTTLARTLAGLRPPSGGTIAWAGSPGDRPTPADVQLVHQDPRGALNPRRTVGRALARPVRRRGRVPRAALEARVAELLATVDLAPELAGRYPHELSGGQRQRVALARALAADPRVLICDETTSALDPGTAAVVLRALDRFRAERGTALLIISHDSAVVDTWCHRRVELGGAPAPPLTTADVDYPP